MKSKYFSCAACLCFLLAAVSLFAQPSGSERLENQGLSHYIMGLYCEDLGDIDRAIQEYQQALKTDPQSPLLHLKLASGFIKKNDAAAAISELEQAATLAPEAIEPHAILALLYAGQNQPDLATQEYVLALENASKLEPKNIEIYKNLGAIYLQQKKLKEAESIYRLVVDISPRDPQAHFYLANVYYDLKNNSAVEKELKAALKLKPDYHEALNFLGYFYLEQDKLIGKAGAMISKALELEPDNGAYLDSLGWFYFKRGKFKEALVELEKAASYLSDPVIYEHLGDVYLRLGNRDSAKLNWEKSLKLDPRQEKVKEKLLKFTDNGQ